MPEVFVGLGSNVERGLHLREALQHLRQHFGVLRVSPVYESAAVGFCGNPFFNLVVAFTSGCSPAALVTELREIEQLCGRDRQAPKFAPRPLDLDLLLYGDVVMDENGLRLPREDILRYGFVLGPLAELAPGLQHPVRCRSYAELWSDFSGEGRELRLVQIASD